jgi:adenosylmethionine---8-amino-7-oxononanoate aminotransferase
MKSLSQRSADAVWHPFTQMKIADLPIAVVKGEGVYLYDESGKSYIDAISSWWTTLHGHGHPYIAQQIAAQAKTLEHVIFAGFTHEPAVRLAERLLQKLPGQQSRVFFSDNGSTAVEVGLKMAFQFWHNQGTKKSKVIAFKGAYHGDTFGAMAVGDRSAFTEPFFPFLFDVEFVESPAINAELCLKSVNQLVAKGDVAAIIFEPLVQGAGGMLMYDASVLNEIIHICRQNDVLVIADEVMTCFYRTGKFSASDYLNVYPDIFCLSKGLTGGVMAMGVTTCTSAIYEAFLSDDFMHKTFFHGHSFTANPLACASANASLDLLEKPETLASIERIARKHSEFLQRESIQQMFINHRQMGTIAAFDVPADKPGYGSAVRDVLNPYFLKNGILMRPLGNTLYLLPPYCITDEQLDLVYNAIENFKIEYHV